MQAKDGNLRMVIGTRSAGFTPFKNLWMIIVDEEHDPSFKQQNGLRYSGRDIAIVRAMQSKASIVLGSATPSFESLMNCLLYTSDAADERSSVDLGGRRIIKKR